MGCWDLKETYLERNFWLGDSWHWGAGQKVCPASIRCQGEKGGGWPGDPALHSDGLCVSLKDLIFHSQLQAFCGGEHIFNYLFYFQRLRRSMQLIDNSNTLLSLYENLWSLCPLTKRDLPFCICHGAKPQALSSLFVSGKKWRTVSFTHDLSP